jgi:hypothetical protein
VQWYILTHALTNALSSKLQVSVEHEQLATYKSHLCEGQGSNINASDAGGQGATITFNCSGAVNPPLPKMDDA